MPPRSEDIDLPSEILADSRRALVRGVRWPIYVWMAVIGAVVWSMFSWLFLVAAAPLIGLYLLTILAGTELIQVLLRTLGLSPGLVLTSLLGAPVLGAVLGAAAVPLAMRWVLTIRPREYLTEAGFQREVARRFALVQAIPQLAVIALLVLLVLLPIRTPWQHLSFGVLAGLAGMVSTVILGYLCTLGLVRALRPLGLPSVADLDARAARATTRAERTRLLGILYTQDRRHLPRATTFVGPRMLLASARAILVRHWWVLLVAALLGGAIWWFADVGQTFAAFSYDATGTGQALDPQLGSDVPALTIVLVLLAFAAWIAVCAVTPAALVSLISASKHRPSDLRTYPSVRERFAVNPWEKRVVWNAVGVIVVAEMLLLSLVVAIMAALGLFSTVDGVWATLLLVVLIPCSGVATFRALAHDLRDIVYGPAHWYARRATPIAALAPAVGTKADVAADPRVRDRITRQRADALGLGATASAEDVAREGAKVGLLPDFGIRETADVSWQDHEPERTSEHSIPTRLESLERQK